MATTKPKPPLVELTHIQPIYADEIGRVDRIGSKLFLTFAEYQPGDEPDRPDRVVVAKMVLQTEAVAGVVRALLNHADHLTKTDEVSPEHLHS